MKPSTKNDRPVNLDLSTIKLPLAAITSITHRISGVIMFAGIGILLWMLELSLSGEAGFNRLAGIANVPSGQLLWSGVCCRRWLTISLLA